MTPEEARFQIYIDADGCPVKDEVYRVAGRHRLKVWVVANKRMKTPHQQNIEMHVVSGDPDAADNWIAEHIGHGDVCVTAGIPLADRCLKADALALDPRGNEWTEDNIADAMASREVMKMLREMGEVRGGTAPMKDRDRSLFLPCPFWRHKIRASMIFSMFRRPARSMATRPSAFCATRIVNSMGPIRSRLLRPVSTSPSASATVRRSSFLCSESCHTLTRNRSLRETKSRQRALRTYG